MAATDRRRWERRFERGVVTFVNARLARASAGIALSTVAAWIAAYETGGTGPVISAFYIPVIIAATRFSVAGAVVVGVVGGVLAGPALPLDVAAGTAQPAGDWLIRCVFFVIVGVVVALLSRDSKIGFGERVAEMASRAELERALAGGEFHVAYQPQFDLETGRLVGAEALARWNHPTRGAIPPDTFIPMCEQAKFLIELDNFVLETATRQLVRWRQNAAEASEFWVSVNIGADDLADGDLVVRVNRALTSAGLEPDALHLEITESSVVRDIDLAVAKVNELRGLGVKVAIDDFGTGQSSLAYLHRFEADVIKLDRLFVRNVADRRVQALAGAVVGLASSLGATTVAEGIETEQDADIIRVLGFTCGQGYYYARPGPPQDIERILAMAAPIILPPNITVRL